MQITEVSVIGVRSAVVELRHREKPLKFRLFPMVHFGKPTFYRQVGNRLRDCAVIVSEGRDGASSTGLAYVAAMRITGQRGARELVNQDIDHKALGVPTIWPDGLPGAQKRRTRLGVFGWLDVLTMTPIFVVSMLVGGRGWLLRRRLEVSDDTEVRTRLFSKMMVEDRDKDLLKALEKLFEERQDEDATIAVVYGAGHIPAVVQGLNKRYGYRARTADWLSVIDI